MVNDAEGTVRSYFTPVKEDLMTGVPLMVPFATTGGIFLALGHAVASFSNNVQDVSNSMGTVGQLLAQIGVIGLTLMTPMLSACIVYTTVDRSGLASGSILSYIIQWGNVLQATGDVIGLQGDSAGAGYLGAIIAGFLAGVVVCRLRQCGVPEFIAPMTPVLLIPITTIAVLTPVMPFVLGVPIPVANVGLIESLSDMQGDGQATLLGGTLGAMVAADMGGPINKVTYMFSTGLISGGVTTPMAVVMITGTVPPVGLTLSNPIASQKYATETHENAKSSVLLGFPFITEGAIPHATAGPTRVVSSVVAGSAVVGAASMAPGVSMSAPHGGILVVLLSSQPFMFIVCILLGPIMTVVIATAIKPNFDAETATQGSDD